MQGKDERAAVRPCRASVQFGGLQLSHRWRALSRVGIVPVGGGSGRQAGAAGVGEQLGPCAFRGCYLGAQG